ncbi:MAG: CDP-glycerol glycerophosphotransferase family protein [Candidatus Sungbacteria bacterium]|nr:CDP-glycerol glycerophosphotransferase family protein [Candidatus Sungbacteria bacterium]
MKKLLIVADSPGSAEFIAPVIPLLQKKTKIVVVTVNTSTEAPYTILKKYKPLRCDHEKDAEALFRKIKPDILLAGTSSLIPGPFVNNCFIRLMHREQKPVLVFQDYWANHRWPQNKETLHLWNAVFVPDELAKKFLQEDAFSGNIITTGNPAFDKFTTANPAAIRNALRKELNIRGYEFVILYAGTGTPQAWQEDEATFRFLANALQEFFANTPNIVFIPRSHPRDEEKNRYQKLAPRLRMYNPDHGKNIYSTDNLLLMADCIISMYSTALLHACFLKIPAISILLPDAGRARLRKINLDNFPPNTVGATIGVYKESTKDLVAAFDAVKNDPHYRQKITNAQTQFFSLAQNKKSATETAADAITSFIRPAA